MDHNTIQNKIGKPFVKFCYGFKGCMELENNPRMLICKEIAGHR